MHVQSMELFSPKYTKQKLTLGKHVCLNVNTSEWALMQKKTISRLMNCSGPKPADLAILSQNLLLSALALRVANNLYWNKIMERLVKVG